MGVTEEIFEIEISIGGSVSEHGFFRWLRVTNDNPFIFLFRPPQTESLMGMRRHFSILTFLRVHHDTETHPPSWSVKSTLLYTYVINPDMNPVMNLVIHPDMNLVINPVINPVMNLVKILLWSQSWIGNRIYWPLLVLFHLTFLRVHHGAEGHWDTPTIMICHVTRMLHTLIRWL